MARIRPMQLAAFCPREDGIKENFIIKIQYSFLLKLFLLSIYFLFVLVIARCASPSEGQNI